MIYFPKWVTVSRACELTGYSSDEITQKIEKKFWVDSVHWRTTAGEIEIDLVAIDNWVYQSTSTGRRKVPKKQEPKNSVELISKEALIATSTPIHRSSGIYFLILGGEIIYVGQSINVLSRVGQHALQKQFDSFCFIHCPIEHLNQTEQAYIKEFKPKLNGLQ